MIFIIVPIHNSIKHIKPFVECLKKQICKDICVVIVDCGSKDAGFRYIKNSLHKTSLIACASDVFWSEAIRKAHASLKYILSSSDAVAIMNIDAVFDKNFIKYGIENVNHKVLAVATSYDDQNHILMDGGVHVDWSKLSFTLTEEDKNIASARGLFMTGQDFVNYGTTSKYLPHYCSDYELTHRLVKKHGFIIKTPKNLALLVDNENTGIANPRTLKELFSIKCPDNPYYKSIFILLSCPKKYWLINILRAWSRIIRIIIK